MVVIDAEVYRVYSCGCRDAIEGQIGSCADLLDELPSDGLSGMVEDLPEEGAGTIGVDLSSRQIIKKKIDRRPTARELVLLRLYALADSGEGVFCTGAKPKGETSEADEG